ncbi:MAG TPA: hypothetical protein VMY34_10910 [Acidimicrobiales bacterium]|nr:hypothetical protein [Acidimicrobiales bacterium]
MRVAFATCLDLADGFDDDHPTAALLGATFEVWSDPAVDWDGYDRVVIRSTWDYARRADEFVQWTRRVGPARLRNHPEVIAWNSNKTYLVDLAAAGIPTVPTTFFGRLDRDIALIGEVVVKPAVSAGARDTGRFGPGHLEEARSLVEVIVGSGRTAMVQPYLEGVDQAGETAVVVLGDEVSHVLHKKPVLRPNEVAPVDRSRGDFAPAEAMLDPDLVTAGRADADQLALARRVVAELGRRFGPTLFARVDMVPGSNGSPVVLEVEAVEPCLYLHTAPGASERFAAAIRGS